MVLKKSNSGLNSGATQRLNTQRVVPDVYKNLDIPEHCVIIARDNQFSGVTRQTRPPIRLPADRELDEKFEAAEKLLKDYLNTDDLTLLHGSWQEGTINPFRFQLIYGCLFSINKAHSDILRATMNRMMEDVEFSTEISQYVDLKILQNRRPGMSNSTSTTRQWSAYDTVVKNANKGHVLACEDCTKTSNKTRCSKSRGLQRSHMLRKDRCKKSCQTPEEENRPDHTLYVEFVFPRKFDSRDANSFQGLHKPSHKAQKKSKHLKSFLHRETRYDIQQGIDVIDNLMDADEEMWTQIHQTDDILGTNSQSIREDSQNHSIQCDEINSENISLARDSKCVHILDFCHKVTIKPSIRQKRKKSRQLSASTAEYEMTSITKHDKGFVFKLPNDSPDSVVFFSNKNDQTQANNESNHMDPMEEDEGTENVHSTKTDTNIMILQIEQQVNDALGKMNDDLVSVNLIVSDKEISPQQVSNEKNNADSKYLKDRECVQQPHEYQYGNCTPLCFVIPLPCSKEAQNDNRFYLTGQQTSELDNWKVGLVDSQVPSGNLELKTSLSHKMETVKCNVVSLDELVNIATQIIQNIAPDYNSKQKGSPEQSVESYSKWDKYLALVESSSLTPDMAFSHLSAQSTPKDGNQSQDPQSLSCFISSVSSSTLQSHCRVCFLGHEDIDVANRMLTFSPCAHTVCLMCWRSYVYYTLKNNQIHVGCPETDCQTEANTAIMTSFLPFHVVQKWKRMKRDRLLETSPSCAWCPNKLCGHVVLLKTTPERKDFCVRVRCKCGAHFCHSCQCVPHWPSSCDQFRVYAQKVLGKNLLSHQSYSMTVNVRPCPRCKYPIEKYLGCSHMWCIMCDFHFDWSQTHDDPHIVKNEVVFDHPVQYITSNCGRVRKNLTDISKIAVLVWLKKLQNLNSSRINMSFHQGNVELARVRDMSARCAQDSIEFLRTLYSISEQFYLLIGFSVRNTTNKCSKNLCVNHIESLLSKLEFIASRVKDRVLFQPVQKVFQSMSVVSDLIGQGELTLSELVKMYPYLQNKARDNADLSWVENVDLSKFLRFK